MTTDERLAKIEKDIEELKSGQAAIYRLIEEIAQRLEYKIRDNELNIKREIISRIV